MRETADAFNSDNYKIENNFNTYQMAPFTLFYFILIKELTGARVFKKLVLNIVVAMHEINVKNLLLYL